MDYQLLLLLHLLIAGYWLGGDLGVFYIAGKIADPAQPLAVRLFSARSMMLLDMIPRSCLILAFGTGVTLAARMGIIPLDGWLWLVWAVTGGWMTLAWFAFLKEHSALGLTIARIDFSLRLIILALCVGAGIDAFSDGGLLPQVRCCCLPPSSRWACWCASSSSRSARCLARWPATPPAMANSRR